MRILSIFAILTFTTALFAQDFGIEKKDPCYKKAEKLSKQKFGAWECGKLAGVVDCNEALEYDQAHDIVLKRATDFVNRDGAGKPFSGKCESCFMNGILQRRITFVDGKENGIDTTYYKTGCPKVVRNHIQGEESGTWTYFYDSTQQIAWEMNYYLGEKHGRQVYMKANGDTTKIETYRNGVLHGAKKRFYKDTKIYKEADYANGHLNGVFKTYNFDGQVTEECEYSEGKKNGSCKYYYDDGVLLRTENWDMGTPNGEFKSFYYQGFIQSLASYEKGIKHGKFEEYYHDQTIKRSAIYEKGELIEEHKYDELGNETYSFGAPTGNQNEDDELPGTKR